MPEFDVLIKGGKLVDGTGIPAYTTDIAIRDGRVAEIGGLRTSTATRVLDGAGLIVAPGFVDLHTHYDSQIQWDPYCTISGWHGVTSVALGNCGFGFAPVRPEERDRAMLMMSRNEAISLDAMRAGMLWDWTTFPEWMDTLDRIPKGVNCLSYVPVSPLMIWVMGLEASKSRGATEAERQEMQRLLDEAMDVGACGWSVQRLGDQSVQCDFDGTPMPTDVMTDEDVLALAEVLRRRDEGIIQITQLKDFGAGQFGTANADLLFHEQLAEVSGRPMLYNVVAVVGADPEFHRGRLKWLEDCNARGLRIFGQGNNVRVLPTFTLEHFNLWDISPAWKEATLGDFEEKLRKLADPARRAALVADEPIVSTPIGITGPVEDLIVRGCGDSPDLQRYVGRTVGEIAQSEAKHVIDVLLDLSVTGGLKVEFQASISPVSSNPDLTAELMRHPYIIPGVSDGGAHSKFFTGASYPTDFLAWLVRDTGMMTLEEAHYHLSYLPAHAAGFKNRGYLREGAPADIVVYDLDELKLVPEWGYDVAYDQPSGDWRRIQTAEGYRWIMVNGEVTFEDGKCTGETPGRLLRHGKG